MLLRLSKNAFVRQYGEFTYVLERVKWTESPGDEAHSRGVWEGLSEVSALPRPQLLLGMHVSQLQRDG